jgi:long-subunit fatty acid transport protein
MGKWWLSRGKIPLNINYLRYVLAGVSLCLGGLITDTQARNGFIPSYMGTSGLTGGAHMGFAQDASNVITSPAALARLPNHLLIMTGFQHQDQYLDSSKAIAGNPIGKQKNGYHEVPIGTLGFNYRLNDKFFVGLGVSGGGGFVKFKNSTTNPNFLNPPNGNFNTQASNNIILGAATVSYAHSPEHSYGLALLVGYSGFKTNLAKTDFRQTEGRLEKDTSFGLGGRIGGMWDINKSITIGSSISTPVFFQQHKKYRDLFTTPMQIPATFLMGFAWHITPDTHFLFDVKELFYGAARWLRNGQGWRNQTVFLTGIQHQLTDSLIVGVGYNYGEPPINSDKVLVNSLSIPLDEHNLMGGIRYKITEKVEFVGVVSFTPNKKMTDNGGGGGGGGSGIPPQVARGTTLESKAYSVELGIKINF